MIFETLKWNIDPTQLERVHTKASSKIKRLGRSVSQRRMPREAEEPPLTMIDEKPTDGTSTSKKDQDGHGMMKSEKFQRVPNPDDELNIFLKMIMEWWMLLFFSTEFSWQSFFGFCTHVEATTVCTTGGVHTLTCCTHIFLLHSLSAHSRTSSCVCTYTHGSSVCKKVFAYASYFSISPSPLSCFTSLCCSCPLTSRSPLSPQSCRTCPS